LAGQIFLLSARGGLQGLLELLLELLIQVRARPSASHFGRVWRWGDSCIRGEQRRDRGDKGAVAGITKL
jgi:hypothetical protein